MMTEQSIPVPAGLPTGRTHGERRAAVRYQSNQKFSFFQTPQQSERLWARVRNISVSGIGMILSRGLPRGTVLTIDLKDLQMSARVIHSTRDAAGTWLVGCRFDTKLSEAQLLELL
jgi:PilZ domain